MIANTQNKKIFLSNQSGLDLLPRVVNKRKIVKENGSQAPLENNFEDILTVELSCFIDQRKLIKHEISEIKVFTSVLPLGALKKRQSVLTETPSDIKFKMAPSAMKSSQQETQTTAIKLRSDFIDIVNDFDMISQNASASRSSSLIFLTKVSVNQILSSSKIKSIQGLSQSDSELFGRREFFEVMPILGPKSRRIAGRVSPKKVSTPIQELTSKKFASLKNFSSAYFAKVSLGKDPLASFQYADNFTSFQESIQGISSIAKYRKDELREVFRMIAQEETGNGSDTGNLRITKKKETKRNEIYKTTFEISRMKLRSMAENLTLNLIFYAYDSNGNKVDSYGQILNITQLFSTEVNPTIDFDIGISRSSRGNIITSVSNKEMMTGNFNIYQKFFSKCQNYKRKSFKLSTDDFDVNPKNTISLVDGKVQNVRGRPTLAKTKTVFHRITSNFQGKEVSNTYAAGIAASERYSNQTTCAVYVKMNDNRGEITISNLSEDVFAVLPVKRVAKGTRGNDFTTVQQRSSTSLVDNKKSFIRQDSIDPVFTFFDDDLEDDVIYEYAAILFNKSGFPQVSGARFLEKNVERENLINAEVESETLNFATDNNGAPTVGIKFNITLNRQEDDVDKIINSLFGDNRSLFEDDLKEIKDASNFLYGVRVHKIDSTTGEFSFVGSFRGSKQASPTDAANTDIPKTYKVEFEDFSPASGAQIYKIDPYLIPPSQVLDKIYSSLLNMIKNNNRSRSPINRMFVSRQRILNQSVVSEIGAKYASIQGRRGAISSTQSFVEINKNDLFLEGATGDIVYASVSTSNRLPAFDQFAVKDSSISLFKTLDTDRNTTNFIPKNLINVEFSVGDLDNFVDFYVVLRKENGDRRIIIDGAIHSTDLIDDNKSMNYKYLSKIKTSVGLISYFIVPVSKLGTKGSASFLGSVVLRGI